MLVNGFMCENHRINLAGRPGIWKPQVMQFPLSIRTTFGGPYPDKLNKNGLIEYRFRRDNPNYWDNVGLSRKNEESRRKREEQERIIREQQQRIEKERSNFKDLYQQAKRWQRARFMREYIKAVEDNAHEKGSLTVEIQNWLIWARAKADWYDPLVKSDDAILSQSDKDKLV